MVMLNLSWTALTISLERFLMSLPLAPPLFTKTSACLSWTAALPKFLPFHPACSIIHAAGIFTFPLGRS